MKLESGQEIKIEFPNRDIYAISLEGTIPRLIKNDTVICYALGGPLSQKTFLYAVECLLSEITDAVKTSLP